MKTLKWVQILFIMTSLGFSSFSLAVEPTALEVEGEGVTGSNPTSLEVDGIAEGEIVDNNPAVENSSASAGGPFRTCQEAQQRISEFCNRNDELITSQEDIGLEAAMGQGGVDEANAGELVNAQIATYTPTYESYKNIRDQCQKGYSSCQQRCGKMHEQASLSTPPNQAQANYATEVGNSCKADYDLVMTTSKMKMGEILQLLTAAYSLLKQLGLGGDGDGGLPNPDEDKDEVCEKYNKKGILVGMCDDALNNPDKGTRPVGTLTGTGTGAVSGTDNGIMTSSQGDPGGTSKGGAKKAGAFNPNGGGMGGGFGGAVGAAGAGAAEAGANSAGLDTDIRKGFMSADGGGGGSSGFGSSNPSKSGSSTFGKSGLASGFGGAKSAFNKKLNKFASKQKRGVASSGGANGPFQDNWMIIRKAYKKNSNTMFHQ